MILEDIRNLLNNRQEKYRKVEKNSSQKRYYKLEIK